MVASIRPAEPADLAAVTRIYDHAVRYGTASFETDPPDESEMRRRYVALCADGYPFLVAELGKTIAGYAYAGPHRARPAYRWSIETRLCRPAITAPGDGHALLTDLYGMRRHGDFGK